MRQNKVFARLNAQMFLKGYNMQRLAQALGIHYETLRLKMYGVHSFTLDETLRTKRVLEYPGPLETLFERADDGGGEEG